MFCSTTVVALAGSSDYAARDCCLSASGLLRIAISVMLCEVP